MWRTTTEKTKEMASTRTTTGSLRIGRMVERGKKYILSENQDLFRIRRVGIQEDWGKQNYFGVWGGSSLWILSSFFAYRFLYNIFETIDLYLLISRGALLRCLSSAYRTGQVNPSFYSKAFWSESSRFWDRSRLRPFWQSRPRIREHDTHTDKPCVSSV